MILRPISVCLCLCFWLAVLPTGGTAQTVDDPSQLSGEALRQKFDSQLTRSLRIISPGAVPPTVEEAATTDYVEFGKEDQVNLRIAFDFDSAALRDDQKPKLATLCEVMLTSPVQLFRIVGHTDAVGPADYNERLSKLRAEEVKRHLVGDCGIALERLQAVGEGEKHLFDPGDPKGEENRRVEFQALS